MRFDELRTTIRLQYNCPTVQIEFNCREYDFISKRYTYIIVFYCLGRTNNNTRHLVTSRLKIIKSILIALGESQSYVLNSILSVSPR